MTDWGPATEAETAMRDALRAADQELYFRILARTEMLLPVSPEALAGRAPMGWGTWNSGGRTHVLAFTSAESMRACLAEHAGSARRIAYHELAGAWPNHEWWLAVNPGLPIEGYLPPWFVTQLARGDVRMPGRTTGVRRRAYATAPADSTANDIGAEQTFQPFGGRAESQFPRGAGAAAATGARREAARATATAARDAFTPTPPPAPDEPIEAEMVDADSTSVPSAGAHSAGRSATASGRPAGPSRRPRRHDATIIDAEIIESTVLGMTALDAMVVNATVIDASTFDSDIIDATLIDLSVEDTGARAARMRRTGAQPGLTAAPAAAADEPTRAGRAHRADDNRRVVLIQRPPPMTRHRPARSTCDLHRQRMSRNASIHAPPRRRGPRRDGNARRRRPTRHSASTLVPRPPRAQQVKPRVGRHRTRHSASTLVRGGRARGRSSAAWTGAGRDAAHRFANSARHTAGGCDAAHRSGRGGGSALRRPSGTRADAGCDAAHRPARRRGCLAAAADQSGYGLDAASGCDATHRSAGSGSGPGGSGRGAGHGGRGDTADRPGRRPVADPPHRHPAARHILDAPRLARRGCIGYRNPLGRHATRDECRRRHHGRQFDVAGRRHRVDDVGADDAGADDATIVVTARDVHPEATTVATAATAATDGPAARRHHRGYRARRRISRSEYGIWTYR